MMAMYTGARREELCSLRCEHVHGNYFKIEEAKTAAGVRQVPIHDALAPTIKRLVEASKDGFVLSGLRTDKHGDRGDGIGKRFGKLKIGLGFSKRHVFHSFRGTVITMLERAEVTESTVQDIVGHERSTLTGRTYSGKSTLEMRRAALAKLAY
jgi:integrase